MASTSSDVAAANAPEAASVSPDRPSAAQPSGVPVTPASDGRWALGHGEDVDTPESAPPQPVASTSGPQMASVVKTTSNFDPRSLNELRAKMKAQMAANAAAATSAAQAMQKVTIPNPHPEDDSDDEDPSPQASPARKTSPVKGGGGGAPAASPAGEGTLEAAMGGLNIQQPPAPLRGVPLSEGVHTRFDADGAARDSPGAANGANAKTVLRGVPPAAGTKVVFED